VPPVWLAIATGRLSSSGMVSLRGSSAMLDATTAAHVALIYCGLMVSLVVWVSLSHSSKGATREGAKLLESSACA
jgi:hypothetical protein